MSVGAREVLVVVVVAVVGVVLTAVVALAPWQPHGDDGPGSAVEIVQPGGVAARR